MQSRLLRNWSAAPRSQVAVFRAYRRGCSLFPDEEGTETQVWRDDITAPLGCSLLLDEEGENTRDLVAPLPSVERRDHEAVLEQFS
jgi:hypothetical protein